MTNPDYTHITVLIDESGSMGHLANDTRGGFNTFLAVQQKENGKATMTVCKFSSGYEIIGKPETDIQGVQPLTEKTYFPCGGTALLDALGRCITDLGKSLMLVPEEQRPGKVLFLVMTDGEENASREYTKSAVANMVKTQEDVYSWNFIYMGANVDAFSESQGMGMRAGSTIAYNATSRGVGAAYGVMSKSVSSLRGASMHDVAGVLANMFHGAANVEDIQDANPVPDADILKKLQTQIQNDSLPKPEKKATSRRSASKSASKKTKA